MDGDVWGWLARKVYESRKQYETKSELIVAIKKAWTENFSKLPKNTI